MIGRDTQPVIELREVSKRYGPLSAVSSISLQLHAGSILCLLGENGAGKSTVIKILTGVELPTSGKILMDGKVIRFDSPRAAKQHGIATVYQELGTHPLMSIGRNFVLGQEPTVGAGLMRRIDLRQANQLAVETMQELGIRRVTDASQLVGTLSGGERQALAVMRAVHFGARVLVLDEPTAALGIRESLLVLSLLRRVRQQGVAILLITHNAYHAAAVGDQFVVMRRGELAAEFASGSETVDRIMQLMAGGEELAELTAIAKEDPR